MFTPTKTFDDQLRAAFQAGEEHERYVLTKDEDYRAPDFEQWRPTLGDPA